MMWLFVLLLAVIVGLMTIVQEAPITRVSSHADGFLQTTGGYNIVDLKAPVLTGPLLNMVAYVATRTVLQPWITRLLLRQNGVDLVRQLTAAISSSATTRNLAPLFYPMTRLNALDYQKHVQLAQESLAHEFLTTGRVGGSSLSPTSAVMTPYRTVMDYHQLYLSKKATPSQVMNKVLQGAQELQPKLRIFASLKPELVLQQAFESDARYQAGTPRSVFDGVPVMIKDDRHVQGHAKCVGGHAAGCVPWDEENGMEDTIVTTFRNAGAIIIGTSVMPEGGMSPFGYSAWFDGPFHPYDTAYYTGGSNAGSGVAVATGLVPVAVGSDGGGSIRVPAAMTGIFGLATTFGRVAFDSCNAYTVIKLGPMTATAHDAALAHVLMGQQPAASQLSSSLSSQPPHFYADLYDGGVHGPPPAHVAGLYDSLQGMRVGIFWDHFLDSDPVVVHACRQVVDFLQEHCGVQVVNITIPHLREMHLAHALTTLSEFGSEWDATFHNSSSPVQMEANTRISVALGKALSSTELQACDKLRAWAMKVLRQDIFQKQHIDVILSPTMGTRVPRAAKGYRGYGETNTALVFKVLRFIPLANWLGFPAMGIPIDYEPDTGLPIGMHVMADAWNEHLLLRVAMTLESQYLNGSGGGKGGASEQQQQRRRRTPPPPHFVDPLAEWLS